MKDKEEEEEVAIVNLLQVVIVVVECIIDEFINILASFR